MVCSMSDVSRLIFSRLSCEVDWMRPVRRWMVHARGGTAARATTVRRGSSTAMRMTMSTRRKMTTAHVRTPRMRTSWMLRASLMARQIESPTDWLAWKRSDRDRMCDTSRDRRSWIM